MNTYLLSGLLLSGWGSAAIYLASPNQRWLPQPWPTGLARTLGACLLAVGLAALAQPLQAAAACFVWAHWLMLLFVLYPHLGALRAHRRRGNP